MKTLLLALFIPGILHAQVSDPQIIWTNPDGSKVDITETVRPSKNRLYPDGVSDEDLGLINPNRPKVIIDQRVNKPLWPRIDQPILAEPKWWDKTED
jgi:hypothetical protein